MSSLASEVIGVTEIPHNTKVPFILVRKSCQEGKETVILQAGVGVTFQVVNRIHINACWMFLFKKFLLNSESGDFSLVGEGRLEHNRTEKKITVYSRCTGPLLTGC